MSVINKMLRDLDRRSAPDEAPGRPGAAPLRAGVASVSAAASPRAGGRSGSWWRLMALPSPNGKLARPGLKQALLAAALVVLALAGLLGGWMVQEKKLSSAPVVASASAPATAPMPPAPVVTPARPAAVVPAAPTAPTALALPAVPNAPKPASKPGSGAVLAQSPRSDGPAPTLKATMPDTIAALPVARPSGPSPRTLAPSGPSPALTPAPASAPASSAVASAMAGSAAPIAAVTDPAQQILRQQQAAREALAQAQALWGNGARDSAIDLLQQALAAAERSMTNSAANRPQGLMLVRELARMLLADGRAQATWDLLIRLEPWLGQEADLLAVRANAAQRLGRHQDSVLAYTAALQSRPNEQRWLLGAAVSLAALGQTGKATEMAEHARQVAPIAKEVQAYLRQAGVVLREP